MKLYVTSLNSGSNGNCYYVGNEDEAVLIDAGISCREIEKRMARLELPMSKVKAIFISHEHSDHIKGVPTLSKKYNLPVYITQGTLVKTFLNQQNPLYVRISSYQPVEIGNLTITAFPKMHDANDPQSFIIRQDNLCIGVFTDIGTPCEHVIKNFSCCNAIFLEANYDSQMLATGSYPAYLKHRINSDVGHLSNEQALELFTKYKHTQLSHIFLSHISKENNDPELVYHLFNQAAGETEIILTSRLNEIPVYEIVSKKEYGI